jgi:hypothetical protein
VEQNKIQQQMMSEMRAAENRRAEERQWENERERKHNETLMKITQQLKGWKLLDEDSKER